jgi:tRNA-specific 2-thiouridylase
VPGGDYRVVLENHGVEMKSGVIELASGEAVGSHSGIAGYTVGQRRGLGIATGQKNFVTDIDPLRNVVVIGNEVDLYKKSTKFSQASWVGDVPVVGDKFEARIRYHADPIQGRLISMGTINKFSFETPARGPTPGQVLVLYRGSQVVGGGIIEP